MGRYWPRELPFLPCLHFSFCKRLALHSTLDFRLVRRRVQRVPLHYFSSTNSFETIRQPFIESNSTAIHKILYGRLAIL